MEKKIFWIGQRRVHPCDISQNLWENCILNKSHLWFIQTSQLFLSFLAKLSWWQEQMMNGKGIFLHVLDMSHKVQCVENIGLISWQSVTCYCGCKLTLCHTSDLSSQTRGCFISLFNNVANRHSPNIKVLNTPKVFTMEPLIRITYTRAAFSPTCFGSPLYLHVWCWKWFLLNEEKKSQGKGKVW